jgi:hypothetical protein
VMYTGRMGRDLMIRSRRGVCVLIALTNCFVSWKNNCRQKQLWQQHQRIRLTLLGVERQLEFTRIPLFFRQLHADKFIRFVFEYIHDFWIITPVGGDALCYALCHTFASIMSLGFWWYFCCKKSQQISINHLDSLELKHRRIAAGIKCKIF